MRIAIYLDIIAIANAFFYAGTFAYLAIKAVFRQS